MSGDMPTYAFRPTAKGEPAIRSSSSRRARLFAGGTYFRAKDPGRPGNNISVEILEETVNSQLIGTCVVTNHNVLSSESIVGRATADILELDLSWKEKYEIYLASSSNNTPLYSIRCKIRNGSPAMRELGTFQFSSLFVDGSKLSVKLSKSGSELAQNELITITPRIKTYNLVQVSIAIPPIAEGDQGSTITGWGVAELRAAVAADPWIEMMPRSGPTVTLEGGSVPGIQYDAQDDGIDAAVLNIFPDTHLSGGDGLPAVPTAEQTGPTRALVHVNYGEKPDGTLGEVNEVYEWAGDSASNGEWVKY